MHSRLTLAKNALAVAAAVATFTSTVSIPTFAAAQYYGGSYYDPCRRDQNNRAVTGALLGAAAGAALGNSVARGGGRTGGTVIGGLAGAAVGAKVGQSTAACDDSYAYRRSAPPPAPYAYRRHYHQATYSRCGTASRRTDFPDGSFESHHVRACEDSSGRWHVV